MKDLLFLRHATHCMAPKNAMYIQSKQFIEDMDRAMQDENLRVALTVALLDEVALDPLVVTRKERRVYADDKTETEWFNLQFHTLANFVGPLLLARGSPAAQAVHAAIERNLSSVMFQAATDYRTHQAGIHLATKSAQMKADAAYDAIVHGAGQETPGVLDAAKARYDEVFAREMKPFNDRSRALYAAALPLLVGKGFSDACAGFLFRHIRGSTLAN